MGVYIKGMEMPENCFHCRFSRWDVEGGFCDLLNKDADMRFKRHDDCPLIEVPDHGDLIDMDDFSHAMYHEAFEVDSDMQKWESGCWIRYKMFEKLRDSAPVVIPAERREDE